MLVYDHVNTVTLSPRLGAMAGIAGSLFFAMMWTAAVVADGSWQLGEMTLSELGDRFRSGHLLFNTGAMVAGILSLLFSVGLFKVLSPKLVGRVGAAMMALASLLLIGVGLFPIDTGTPHTVVSLSFFGTAALALALLISPFAKSYVFHPGMAYLTAILLLVCLVGAAILALPAIEALAVGCLLLWMFVVSIRMMWHHPAR